MSIQSHLLKFPGGRGTCLLYHLIKQRLGILEEVVWAVKLLHCTIAHYLIKRNILIITIL